MINNTPESKLDEAVKNTLNNYEASYDAADWSRMEKMLDATPKSPSFKWSQAVPVLIGIVVIAGGYALFNAIGNSGNTTDKPVPEETPKKEIAAPPVKTTPPPAINTATNTVSPEKTSPANTSGTLPVVETPAKTTEKILSAEDKSKSKKTRTETQKTEPGIIEPHDKIMGMGNEPVFGDMLDSSKGIIGETKEKEETKKAAKAKKDAPVWDLFTPHMNIDSMRKVREQRDSLKNQ
jgi:hypothetical protein